MLIRHPGLLTTLIATILVSMAADARAASSGPELGAVVDITWGSSRSDIDRTVESMRAAGVRWVRASLNWRELEPRAAGGLDQTRLAERDYAIQRARAAGLEVLMPIADGVPYWASGDPSKFRDAAGEHYNPMWRPARAKDYGAFVGAMVRRYRPMGVHTYEIWNEPNVSRFWPSGPDARQYAQLLAAAYPAVKAADPQAVVLTGGLSKSDYAFVSDLYAAGARRYFDAVAIHPYTGNVDPLSCWKQAGTTKLAFDAFCGIEEVRNTMVANGDSAKSIWLTEFGWSTTRGPYGVTEATQATFLVAALNQLKQYPYVRAAFWYNGRDTASNPDVYDDNLGVLRSDFTPKPAYAALANWASLRLAGVSKTVARARSKPKSKQWLGLAAAN
jgi:arabinogalactan endo-1,4-beta-galactosidase